MHVNFPLTEFRADDRESFGSVLERDMFHRIREYPLVKVDGCAYRPMAYGDPQPDGTWNGWLVFFPLDSGTAVASDLETTQPDVRALSAWASDLDDVYLEGSLFFALRIGQRLPVTADRNIASSDLRGPVKRTNYDGLSGKWNRFKVKR
jgi:hypothetical protein